MNSILRGHMPYHLDPARAKAARLSIPGKYIIPGDDIRRPEARRGKDQLGVERSGSDGSAL
jgi:hypothetical protein